MFLSRWMTFLFDLASSVFSVSLIPPLATSVCVVNERSFPSVGSQLPGKTLINKIGPGVYANRRCGS